jgi:hypothetical protein
MASDVEDCRRGPQRPETVVRPMPMDADIEE